MPRCKIATTVYLTPEQDMHLKELHQRIKVPVAELVRQGVDLVLERYQAVLQGPGWNGRTENRRERT